MQRAKTTPASSRSAKNPKTTEIAPNVRERSGAAEKLQIATMLRRINATLDEVEAQADRLLANAK